MHRRYDKEKASQKSWFVSYVIVKSTFDFDERLIRELEEDSRQSIAQILAKSTPLVEMLTEPGKFLWHLDSFAANWVEF